MEFYGLDNFKYDLFSIIEQAQTMLKVMRRTYQQTGIPYVAASGNDAFYANEISKTERSISKLWDNIRASFPEFDNLTQDSKDIIWRCMDEISSAARNIRRSADERLYYALPNSMYEEQQRLIKDGLSTAEINATLSRMRKLLKADVAIFFAEADGELKDLTASVQKMARDVVETEADADVYPDSYDR